MGTIRLLGMLGNFILFFLCLSVALGYEEPTTSPIIWGIFAFYWLVEGLRTFLRLILRED